MICPLDGENGTVTKYCNDVISGKLKPGIIAFPSAFDIEDGRTE